MTRPCEEKSMSIILGGPYNSGVLASDLSDDAATTYFYRETPPEVIARALEFIETAPEEL